MQIYHGESVYGGIVIGRIQVYGKGEKRVTRIRVQNREAEIRRYREAASAALEQLEELYEKALREAGKANAAIFEAHRMMLKDEDYRESIESIIRTQAVNAEYAVARTADNFVQMFSSMEDDYMKGRAADVKDISQRLLSVLRGEEASGSAEEAELTSLSVLSDPRLLRGEETERGSSQEPVILVADDLTPSEIVQLDKDRVLAFVTVHGSLSSHAAILADSMGIPALVSAGRLTLDGAANGKLGIVDGAGGKFYVDPDEETLRMMREAKREEEEKGELLKDLKGKGNITLDGQNILLYANIASMEDLAAALQNDAGGIGLFRSEFIYLERKDFPTEEEQFQIYRTVAETMGKKRVVIRTLDIGADKRCDYFRMEKEENPALGCRAIRICLTRPEIFKTQLRALFRASAFGEIAIMYPMITSVKEIKKIKEIVEEVRRELDERAVKYGVPEQGIMIETPAAAIISDRLAEEVDFFSIGTNDLTQYLLAVDRGNTALKEFYDPHHPAVLRMIKLVVENAHKAGIRVGICGELGVDAALIKEFLAMGVDELSVAPRRILPLRKIVLETNVDLVRAKAHREVSE